MLAILLIKATIYLLFDWFKGDEVYRDTSLAKQVRALWWYQYKLVWYSNPLFWHSRLLI